MDKEIIALWGAILSTILAIVKLWEIWRDRRRIEVSYSFIGIPEVGNDIIIRNLSNTPFIMTYWELQFCSKKWLTWIPYRTEEPCEFATDVCIQGHSSYKLNFSGQDYFDWGHKALGGKRLYLRLHIAGKSKPVTHLVYK